MSRSGFRSMIDSAWAQPTADRSTRKRPETTDTPAPASRHRAMVTRTTSGRRVATCWRHRCLHTQWQRSLTTVRQRPLVMAVHADEA